jgi:hypothetical protein
MHHPQIYDLVSIIEDFFLLNDSNYRSQIEPQIYKKMRKARYDDQSDEPVDFKGLKIIRELNNGRMEINIFGWWNDNDSMDIQYFEKGKENPLKTIEILNEGNNSFNIESVRLSIRDIVILDRETKCLVDSI